MLRILHITTIAQDHELLKAVLGNSEIKAELVHALDLENGIKELKSSYFDIVFSDYTLGNETVLTLLENENYFNETPIVVLVNEASVSMTRDSFIKGAFDFVAYTDLNASLLDRIIRNVSRFKRENKLRTDLEKRLDENYANTKAILNNTSDGIWSVDKNGVLLIINSVAREFMRNYGQEPPTVGEPFFSQLTPDFSSVWKTLYDKAILGDSVLSVNEYDSKEGVFYLEISCSPIYNNKILSGVTYFSRDVTERQKAEEKIRENERNFRSVFTNSDVPIMIEKKDDLTIIDLNQACAKLHGYNRKQMIGMKVMDTIPPEHYERSQKNVELFLSGELENLDSYVYTANKEIIPIQISMADIVYNDIPCNLLFLYDISARKDTERKLREARVFAEKTAEFKSQFLANMSHEIRTPMNAMLGFADLLLDTPLSKEQKEYVEIINNSGQDLLVIINDILDLSKIEAGKMVIRPRDFNLPQLIQKVIQLHNNKAKEKKIGLFLDFGKEIPETVCLDDTRLSQILNNLVSNAIKFTEHGNVEVNVDFDQKKKCLQFKVKDTGIGIPTDQLDTIFENFSQVDSSLQRTQHGTGLGLSIVAELCRLMNGNIGVRSEEGVGSEFSMCIPIQITDNNKTVEIDSGKKEVVTDHLKVLLCEDNPINVKLATKVLSDLGTKHMVVNSGDKGILAVKEFQPDVIFMDIQMPIMDGYEATKEIRKFSNVPIIAMSAHVLEEEQQKCIDAGMNGFIPKPFRVEDIIQELHKLFALKTEPSQKVSSDKWLKLDLPELTNLADGDEEFAISLFDIFLENTEKEIEKFKTALTDNNFEELIHIAHKMKPSLLMFGFSELYDLSDLIESKKAADTDLVKFIELLKSATDVIAKKRSSFIDNN
ncbi:MAG: response regulator [Crocinitomicaceae bacterium]|nr:response regulator [Crocinitomicaceae bacterium]